MALWEAFRAEWDTSHFLRSVFNFSHFLSFRWRSIHFRRDVLLLDPLQPRKGSGQSDVEVMWNSFHGGRVLVRCSGRNQGFRAPSDSD